MKNPFASKSAPAQYVVLITFNPKLAVKHRTRYIGVKIGKPKRPVPTNIHNATRFDSKSEAKEVAALFTDPRYTVEVVTFESQLNG